MSLIIYHDDADGFFSAAAIKVNDREAVTYKINYRDPVPWGLINQHKDSHVYVVDFSFKRDINEKISEICGDNFTLIDHHSGAKDEIIGVKGCQYFEGVAACTACWHVFNPGKSIPIILRAAGDRDIWAFEYENTKEICAGYEFVAGPGAYEFSNSIWLTALIDDVTFLSECLRVGRVLTQNQQCVVDSLIRKGVFQCVDFYGHKAGFGNVSGLISDTGNGIVKQMDVDYSLTYFVMNSRYVVFSLRGSDSGPDVSEVAKRFGGNGHRNAAGFKLDLQAGFSLIDDILSGKTK